MNQLGLFAKYWQPGHVKTRLAAKCGNECASRIYHCFLKHLVEQLTRTPPEFCDQLNIVFSPADKRREFEEVVNSSWSVVPQSDGDLGTRMSAFFDIALGSEAHSRAVIIGSDTPHLSSGRIDEAFAALQESDVVFGPSADGGYYLIGMKDRTLPVFDGVQWSTSAVLEQSLAAVERTGLKCSLLPEMTDVDEMEDLQSLMIQLEETKSEQQRRLLVDLNQLLANRNVAEGKR